MLSVVAYAKTRAEEAATVGCTLLHMSIYMSSIIFSLRYITII
jgi:hypothetical protein